MIVKIAAFILRSLGIFLFAQPFSPTFALEQPIIGTDYAIYRKVLLKASWVPILANGCHYQSDTFEEVCPVGTDGLFGSWLRTPYRY